MSLWLIHHPISNWLLTLISNKDRPCWAETWVGHWKGRKSRMKGEHCSGRQSRTTGRCHEDTGARGSITLCPCGPVVTSTCLRTWLDAVEVLAAPAEGVSRLQSHHLLFSNLPSLRRPVISLEYKFGHHSPALAMIPCFGCRVKLKFFSMAWKAFHDPIFQPVPCCCAIFTHIPAIPNHLSLPAPVPLTLPSCPRTCLPSIQKPLSLHLMASHYSWHKLSRHHHQQDSWDPLIRTRYLFSVLPYYPGIYILAKLNTTDFNCPFIASECLQDLVLCHLSVYPQRPECSGLSVSVVSTWNSVFKTEYKYPFTKKHFFTVILYK